MCKDLCKRGCCGLAMIAKVLVVIGGINWGLVGLGMVLGKGDSWNIVKIITGSVPTLEAIIYILVGVSGLMFAFGCKCKKCEEGVCCMAKEVKEEAPKTE